MGWDTIVPSKDNLLILGNPPFIGKQNRNAAQIADMDAICQPLKTKGLPNYGILDYVTLWYIKAALFIEHTSIKVAFVSTNSITQGEQVAVLWQFLFSKGIKIDFAHRTFRWSNEARGKAQVFCVIIGFSSDGRSEAKRLFDYETPQSEAHEIFAKNINPYLVDAPDVVIPSRTRPLCKVPEILKGNQPTDAGYFLFNDEEKAAFLNKEPKAEGFIRKFLGAQEFINGQNRWCLWLKDTSPSQWRMLPEIVKRIELVKEYRLKSTKAATVKKAEIPYLFDEIRHPESDYLLIPSASSENRRYVPIGYISKDVIASNAVMFVPNPTSYLFGVLTSTMHMAWMRAVCGRLKSDYRYSNNIVYNNFPFPEAVSEKQQAKVEEKAQAVISARELFPNATLADLYDPLSMPRELLKAHRELDEAVDATYRRAPFKTELERLEYLFELYTKYAEPLTNAITKTLKRSRKLII